MTANERSSNRTEMSLCDWITLGAAMVLIVAAFVLGVRCGAGKSGTVVLRDTLRLEEIVADTVIRWYERIVWKELEPDTIMVYRDTVDVDTVWGRWPEAIIALDYCKTRFDKGELTFTSIAPVLGEDSHGVLRDYYFEVDERFEIRTRGEGFHVRSTKPRLRLCLEVGAEYRLLGFNPGADSASSPLLPFATASLNWRGLDLGPRIDTRGVHLTLAYRWEF